MMASLATKTGGPLDGILAFAETSLYKEHFEWAREVEDRHAIATALGTAQHGTHANMHGHTNGLVNTRMDTRTDAWHTGFS